MIDFFSRVYFHSHCRRVALLKLAEEEKIHKRESRGDDDSSISDGEHSHSLSLCARLKFTIVERIALEKDV